MYLYLFILLYVYISRPALVLVDFYAGSENGLNGSQMITRMKQEEKHIKSVFLSSNQMM